MATSTRNSCFELLFPISIQVMCLSSMEKQCPMPLLDVHVIVSFLFIPSFHMHTPVYLPIWALEWNPTCMLMMTASLHSFDSYWLPITASLSAFSIIARSWKMFLFLLYVWWHTLFLWFYPLIFHTCLEWVDISYIAVLMYLYLKSYGTDFFSCRWP